MMESDTLNQATIRTVASFLTNLVPDEADIVIPFVEKLFIALADGHTFIWLEENDIYRIKQASNIVGSGNKPLILMGNRLFLGRIWQLEHDLAEEIYRLASTESKQLDWMQSSTYLNNWFQTEGSEEQKNAAALALMQHFMLITGGPGTGKTTTVAKLLGLICVNSPSLPRIGLVAPTGKAAAHMARALHRALDDFDLPIKIREHLLMLEGQTVHRLLKLRPPQMQSTFNQQYPLPFDVLVVDEASMLDISLLLQLLKAIASGCRIILLGDEYQLPSVGVGAILSALSQPTILSSSTAQELTQYLPHHNFKVEPKALPLSENIARLSFSHRFGENSGIGCLARAVAEEDSEKALAQFNQFPEELRLLKLNTRELVELFYAKQNQYWQAIDANNIEKAYAHLADIVLLSAWRKDSEYFNSEYIRYLQKKRGFSPDNPWFSGKIIMVTSNDYTLNLFNGDIGLIMVDSSSSQGLSAYFPEKEGFKKVTMSRLPAHESAFAITVHKSQGSEYREVWLLPPSENSNKALSGLNRALLYTGITRARKLFSFLGDEKVFSLAVQTNEFRRTALYEMIKLLF